MLAGPEACTLPVLQHLHTSVQAKKTWGNSAVHPEEDLARVQSALEAVTKQQSRLLASQPHNRLSSNTGELLQPGLPCFWFMCPAPAKRLSRKLQDYAMAAEAYTFACAQQHPTDTAAAAAATSVHTDRTCNCW